ncbi:MAG TPA: phenylalanine--tRNA ligase subunit beta [bacterium]|nr:phenylalanine--tRNA ligase subunit beta [bacterium]HPL95507.1 phenylalanine--tRNA ligase subunit beta [bacterium]
MLLSLNWLKKYVNLPQGLSPKQLAHDLTMSTVEVEHVFDNAERFERIVVGKIIEVKTHPNADKLKIVITNIGKKEPAQIVCGGTNLRENMLVPVALPGAKVKWHGEGDLVELQETEIRGVKSFGMICSANEIGLENMFTCGEREIVDLGNFYPLLFKEGPTGKARGGGYNLKPGQNLGQVLGGSEIVLEIDNKSITNRPDLWSHYGVARELSVIYGMLLKDIFSANEKEIKKLRNKEIRKNNLNIKITDKKLCPRYIGCLVKNIKIGPSPEWLQKSLKAVGVRPINNIVDITNYVMLDVGEPMHAFDNSKLKNQNSKLNESEIIIRRAKNGEKIKTLDEVERKLDDSMLVIADSKKPIALAGIMGGADSGVDNNTTEIVLEAASFDAMSVRKTAQKLNLRTEASNRFEKKLAPEFADAGMARALELIREIIPTAELITLVDVNYAKPQKNIIQIEHNFLEKRIGQKLAVKEVKEILERLGFVVKCQSIKVSSVKENKNYIYKITVPFWRGTGDIDCPEDIVEELARIYGYDNLKGEKHLIEMDQAIWQKDHEFRKKIKQFLATNAGFNEVFNYPWVEENTLKKLGFSAKMVGLSNPPAELNKWLATSLIPNLIRNIEDNLRYFDDFKIFELSRVFLPEFKKLDQHFKDVLPIQPHLLAGAVAGEKNKNIFLTAKGVMENLFDELRIMNYELRIKDPKSDYLDNAKHLEIIVNHQPVGWLGEFKPEIYRQFDFKNKEICFWEIDIDELIALIGTGLDLPAKKYQPLPQFPSVIRDLAFEMDWKVKWAEIIGEILRFAQDDKNSFIKGLTFLSEFDLGDRKSVAFRITYQANRTLTEDEVEAIQNKIIKLMADKFNAKLRVSLKK